MGLRRLVSVVAAIGFLSLFHLFAFAASKALIQFENSRGEKLVAATGRNLQD